MTPSFYKDTDKQQQRCCDGMINFLNDTYGGVRIFHQTAIDADSMYLNEPKASDSAWWLVYDGGYSSWPITYCPFCSEAIKEN